MGAADGMSDFDQRLLASHNGERAALGLAPLRWNDRLAEDAGSWATYLATTGRFEHSTDAPRRRIGENIWGGTAGRFTPERMVELWLSEKRLFKPGYSPRTAPAAMRATSATTPRSSGARRPTSAARWRTANARTSWCAATRSRATCRANRRCNPDYSSQTLMLDFPVLP
jgi:hypothetical protein